jgi:hypothetical protein
MEYWDVGVMDQWRIGVAESGNVPPNAKEVPMSAFKLFN